jgi:glycine/D-amino acid oxidase-like deaminating enzyme
MGYELALAGQKVILIDRGPIAGGITAKTTAHLAPLCDDLTSEMTKRRRGHFASFPTRARLLLLIASRKFRRRKKSRTIFGGWTVICFRHSMRITTNLMPSEKSARRPLVN